MDKIIINSSNYIIPQMRNEEMINFLKEIKYHKKFTYDYIITDWNDIELYNPITGSTKGVLDKDLNIIQGEGPRIEQFINELKREIHIQEIKNELNKISDIPTHQMLLHQLADIVGDDVVSEEFPEYNKGNNG
ncbi:MAG: hypothetical protein PHS93_08290 [Candidatus Omnitrophica bacterium]|nr:hypothetical protein [Candidatus Omnitrophota bacterium]MDD5589131.1 hypothetical protein [Candidatus Nanoarchaeia archaeon]